MPVHNSVCFFFFKKSINSVLSNTLKPDEFLIVVDGYLSLNKKLFLLDKKKKFKFIKIVYFKIKIGLVRVLNHGIIISKHNIIARADSDDINHNKRFKKQIGFIKRNNVDILGSNVVEKFNGINLKKNIKLNPNIFDFLISNPLNHPTVIFKKKKILKLGMYPNIQYKEDYLLWIIAKLNGCNIFNLKDCLVTSEYNSSTILRRKNYISILSEFKVFLYLLKRKMSIIPIYFFVLLFRITYLLLPKFLYVFMHKNFFRKKLQ